MKGASKLNPTSVRLPDGLDAWVRKEADINRRSVSSEMIVLIEEAKQRREENAQQK